MAGPEYRALNGADSRRVGWAPSGAEGNDWRATPDPPTPLPAEAVPEPNGLAGASASGAAVRLVAPVAGLGGAGRKDFEIAMLWVLNQSDGEHSLCEVAERSGLPPGVVGEAADALREAGLLEELA